MKIDIDPAQLSFEVIEDFEEIVSLRAVYRGYRLGRFLARRGDDRPSSPRYKSLIVISCERIRLDVAAMSNHARLQFIAATRAE